MHPGAFPEGMDNQLNERESRRGLLALGREAAESVHCTRGPEEA